MLPAAALMLATSSSAEVPGQLDPDFKSNVNGRINSIVEQADGKILIGGSFTQVAGQPKSRLARLTPDGSLDTTFDADVNGSVYAIAPQPDGRIVIGGEFDRVGDQPRFSVARLNGNGSEDTPLQLRGSGIVYSVAVRPDRKILVGYQSGVAQLDPNGLLDTTFDSSGSTTSSAVLSTAIQSDGGIVIGGSFGAVGGQRQDFLARLLANGTLDPSFAPDVQGLIHVVSLQADGKIVIGGTFRSVEGQPRDRLARLNSNGTLDTTFKNPKVNDDVYSVTLQSDGKILIGGDFTKVGSRSRGKIARLNADGGLDVSFTNPEANDWVSSILIQPDDRILIGGAFTRVAGQPRNRVARLRGGSGPPVPDSGSVLVNQPRVKVTKKAVSVSSRVKVSGAGKIAQRATTGKGKKRKTWCRASRKAGAAGTYTVKCKIGNKGRKALRKRPLELSLRTTFTPAAGKAVARDRKLTVKRKR